MKYFKILLLVFCLKLQAAEGVKLGAFTLTNNVPTNTTLLVTLRGATNVYEVYIYNLLTNFFANTTNVVFSVQDGKVVLSLTNLLFGSINATNIANGSVDNTEYQYLDGLTNNIQFQINVVRTNAANWLAVGSFNTLTDGNATVASNLYVLNDIQLNGVSVSDASLFTIGTLDSARLNTDVLRHDTNGVNTILLNEFNVSGHLLNIQNSGTNFVATFSTNEYNLINLTTHSTITITPPTLTNTTKKLTVFVLSDADTNQLSILPTNTIVFGASPMVPLQGLTTITFEWIAGALYAASGWELTTNNGVIYQTSAGVKAYSTNFIEFTAMAGAWVPATTNGAATGTFAPTGSANMTMDAYDFDDTTVEYIQLAFRSPGNWDGTLKARPLWTASAASGNVEWNIAATSYGDGEDISALSFSDTPSSDVIQTANFIHEGPAATITVGNTPAASDWVHVRVSRNTGVGSDAAGDARFLGMAFQLGLTTTGPLAAW